MAAGVKCDRHLGTAALSTGAPFGPPITSLPGAADRQGRSRSTNEELSTAGVIGIVAGVLGIVTRLWLGAWPVHRRWLAMGDLARQS